MPTDAWSDIYPDQKRESRPDLIVEDLFLSDGSGMFTSDWYLSDGAYDTRVMAKFLDGSSQSFTIEEGQWDTSSAPRVMRQNQFTVSASKVNTTLSLTCRAFRIVTTGSSANGYVAVTIRKVA